MVNTGGDERFEKFKTSSKFKPVQRNKKSKVKIDKRFKSMLQKVCSFSTIIILNFRPWSFLTKTNPISGHSTVNMVND